LTRDGEDARSIIGTTEERDVLRGEDAKKLDEVAILVIDEMYRREFCETMINKRNQREERKICDVLHSVIRFNTELLSE